MMHHGRGVRVVHRETGITARVWSFHVGLGRRRELGFEELRLVALRLLRARLWQDRHRIGPQPIVRTYDLTGDDRAAALETLDGRLPCDP